MIDAMATGMAQKLGNILSTEDEVEIYAYALKLVMMSLLTLTLVILAAYLLRIVPVVLAFLAVFWPFRAFGGGVHLSTFPRCTAVGLLITLGFGYLAAKAGISEMGIIIMFLFTLLVVLWVIIKWVPASTATNPIIDPHIIKKRKREMLLASIVWTTMVLALIKFNGFSLALAMIIGAMAAISLMSPGGFFVMEKVDGLINILGKEVKGL
jgi:accessory gene regulator B